MVIWIATPLLSREHIVPSVGSDALKEFYKEPGQTWFSTQNYSFLISFFLTCLPLFSVLYIRYFYLTAQARGGKATGCAHPSGGSQPAPCGSELAPPPAEPAGATPPPPRTVVRPRTRRRKPAGQPAAVPVAPTQLTMKNTENTKPTLQIEGKTTKQKKSVHDSIRGLQLGGSPASGRGWSWGSVWRGRWPSWCRSSC